MSPLTFRRSEFNTLLELAAAGLLLSTSVHAQTAKRSATADSHP